MKNKKKYLSRILFVVFIVVLSFTFKTKANAQLSFAGKQLFFFPEFICNSSLTNVHFILSNGMLLSLYAPPFMIPKGAGVMFGINQIGTYLPIPMPCLTLTPAGPIPIWLALGTYTDAATSFTMKDSFFAGPVVPFVRTVDVNS